MKREGKDGEREQQPGEQVRAEDRVDQAWLEARAHGAGALPHIDPQRAESYQRIEEAISDLPELEPPEGWELVVRAELDALEQSPPGRAAAAAARSKPDGAAASRELDEPEKLDEDWMATGTGAKRPLPALEDFARLEAAATARAVAVEAPVAELVAPLRQARAPSSQPLAPPPRDPLRLLWIPAVGAAAMAAGVMLLAFRIGASPVAEDWVRGGSDALTPQAATGGSSAAQTASIATGGGAGPDAKERASHSLRPEIKPPPGQATRRGSSPETAATGDLFTLDFTGERGQLRLYRDRREIARCPGAPTCTLEERGAQMRFQLSYPMELPGEYRVVYFEGTGMDAPSEGLDKDLTRCRRLDEQAPAAARPVCGWAMSARRAR